MQKERSLYRSGKYYKLTVEDGIGHLQINGVLMHRIKDTDPISDAKAKVKALGMVSGGYILDVGTCLGYTAIQLAKAGARQIFTIEKDFTVLSLARENPASAELFENNRIKIIVGDASILVKIFNDEFFDAILNDPPMLKLAGELYSNAIFCEFFRLLRKGGKLLCYTGKYGWHRNINLLQSVKRRLKLCGFSEVKILEELDALLACKRQA